MNRELERVGRFSFWWGEATDEPAREDARPTDRFMAPMRVRSWKSRLSMNLKAPGLQINNLCLLRFMVPMRAQNEWRLPTNLSVPPASWRQKTLGSADETLLWRTSRFSKIHGLDSHVVGVEPPQFKPKFIEHLNFAGFEAVKW